MPSTYDPLLRLELQATGENATTWGTKTNNNLDLIAAAIAGQAVVTVSSADVTLTEANAATDQSRAAILVFTGTMTGNVNIIVPSQSKTYAAFRQTTGAYDLVIKNATGTGATLPTSGTDIIVCTTATCVGLIGSLAANVSALDTRVAAVSASVSALNVQVADVSAKVSAVDVRVAAVSASVSALNIQIASVSAEVSAVQTNVAAVSALTSTLNTQVAAVSAQVSSLQVQVANVSAITSALDVRLTAVSASVSAINAQLASVSALVSSINSLDIRVTE